MKKLIALLLTCVLSASVLTGCGNADKFPMLRGIER